MMYEGVVPTSIVSLDVLHQYLASEDVLAGRSPISKPNVQQLCEAWAALQGYRRREALVLSPLRPGLILAWAGTCLFPSTRPATVSGDPSMAASKQDVGISGVSTRACTPLLQQDEAGQVGPPGDTSIMLLGPLGITPIHMSEEYDGGLPPYEVSARNSMQVWLGEVFHGGKSSGIKVALKLYDERVLSPEVNRASFHEGEVRYVPGMESGMTLAANDAAAFWKLQSLQGSVVPFSYGHYKVSGACGCNSDG